MWASSYYHQRWAKPIHTRRKCRCGCGQRVTHLGMADNIALIEGCQLFVLRWVKQPRDAYALRFRLERAQGSTRRT